MIATSTEDDSFNLWVQLECNQNANIIKSPFICEELDQMEREGFGIFDIDGNGYIFEIQKNDERNIFSNDDEALIFIKKEAQKGSILHMKIIEFMKILNPEKY